MSKSLLAALALLPVVAIGGEQVIMKNDFGGNAMQKVKYVDGWSLLSYCPGELSREKGTLILKAMPSNGKEWGRMLCVFRNGNLTGCEICDMYTPTEHLENKSSYFRPDNVHLSPRGYGLVARLVLQEMGK